MSVDWNNYQMRRQMPMAPMAPPPVADPAPVNAPPARPTYFGPFGAAGGLLGGLFNQSNQAQANPLGFVGGLLGNLFNKKQPEPEKKTVIDQRPDDVQRLVSMFSNGGQ